MLLTKINQQSSVRVVVSDANQHGDSVAELNATQGVFVGFQFCIKSTFRSTRY